VSDLCLQDAVGLAGPPRRREVSARAVVSAHVARVEAFDPAISAIVTRTFDDVLARAAALRGVARACRSARVSRRGVWLT